MTYPDGVNEDDLVLFLVDAKQAQHRSPAEVEPEPLPDDDGEQVVYSDGPYRYVHQWRGRQRFAGQELVYYRGTPAWILQYYGSEHPHLVDQEDLHAFLREALAKVDTGEPFRGPGDYRRGAFMYYNTPQGTVDSFNGEEIVYFRGEEAHKVNYRGGSILTDADTEIMDAVFGQR